MLSGVWMRPTFGEFYFAHDRKKGLLQMKEAIAQIWSQFQWAICWLR